MSKLYRALSKQSKTWVHGFYYEVPAPLVAIGEREESKGYLIFEKPNTCTDWGMPIPLVRCEIDKHTLCDYVGERDKNGEELFAGDLLEDDEHFVWEILPLQNGKYQIACDDLMAVEDLIPRIHVMQKIGDRIFNADLIHPIDPSILKISPKMKLSVFFRRFKKQNQGYLDSITDKVIYCPADLGFKFNKSNCSNSCKKCWQEAFAKMKSNEGENENE